MQTHCLHFENNVCTKSSVPTKLNLKYAKTETNPRRPLVRITPNPIQKTLTTITEDDTCPNNDTCDTQCEVCDNVGSNNICDVLGLHVGVLNLDFSRTC